MEFSQWKQSMESEATLENKELKEKINSLEGEVTKLKSTVHFKTEDKSRLISDCKALSERCYVLTNGLFYGQCELKEFNCKHKAELEKDLYKVAKEIAKERRKTLNEHYKNNGMEE